MFSLYPSSTPTNSLAPNLIPPSIQRGQSSPSDHSLNYAESPSRSASTASADEYSPMPSPRERTSAKYQWGSSPSSSPSTSISSVSCKALTQLQQPDEGDSEESVEVVHPLKPPTSLFNSSPYDFQLLSRLVPRHITTEHVVFSHKTKVNGRSLYFFSPACRGAPSKPVFTMREKLASLIDTYMCDEEDSDLHTHLGGRTSHSGMTNTGRHHRKEEIAISGVCTLKRVHLFDPACDIGVSVWRGRGPQTGVRCHQKPPPGNGPALLLETREESGGDGMVVAAGFTGEVMFLVPLPAIGRSDFEPRATEIFVHDAVLTCISESVVWFTVKSFTRKRVTSARNANTQRIMIGKFKKGAL